MSKKSKKPLAQQPKKLRVMISSNAPFTSSGYGQQMAEFTPLIRDEGYPLALIDYYGLEGNKIVLDGIIHYPKINHVYGSDALVLHGRDFKADVVFALQDQWVLHPNDLAQVNRYIPICVDGNTLVSFVDGRQIKIEEVVENKISGKVWGYENGKVIPTSIKAWQKIPDKMDVYELKTNKRTLLITGNNEVWVRTKIGRGSTVTGIEEGGWKRADSIVSGDVVYCISNEPSNKESGNKRDKINTNRSGLLRWFDRWRGNSYDHEGQEDKPENRNQAFNTSSIADYKYGRSHDSMGSGKNRSWYEPSTTKYRQQIQSFYKKIIQIAENLLYRPNMGLQLLANTKTSPALFDNQTEKSRISHSIYQISTSSAEDQVQSPLYRKGNSYLGGNSNIEPEIVMAVRKVKSPKRRVFDISTETGNFFANQILIHNCPVDHDPVPNAVLEKLKYAYRIVTYSKFGQKELQRKGLMSTYIPHTVDTEVFKPMDKAERKKAAGLPENSFVLGMVAANKDNPPRKSFQEVLDAFKLFLEQVPQALLYIHTNPDNPGGFPIKEYGRFIGIEDKLLFPDTYQMSFNTTKELMNSVYNTFDVLLSPSFSEGFGVPIIEAQATGTPVIVNNWTSMPELVKPGVTGEICNIASKRFTALGSYAGIPSVESIFECLMKIYKADRVKMGEEARKFIVENYDTKYVFETYWKPFLRRLELEIYPNSDIMDTNGSKDTSSK